jgi:hypothetical protein
MSELKLADAILLVSLFSYIYYIITLQSHCRVSLGITSRKKDVNILNTAYKWKTRRAVYVKRNTEARPRNHCFRGEAICITEYYESVSILAFVISTQIHLFCAELLHPPRLTISFRNISQTARFSQKKNDEHKTCGFWLSIQLSEIFLVLRRKERDVINMHVSLHVKYRYSRHILMKLEILSTGFRKIPTCRMRTDGQTWWS